MVIKRHFLFLAGMFCTIIMGCTLFIDITAKNHEPSVQSPESIHRFVNTHGISGFPILRYDSSFSDFGRFSFFIGMFNKSGCYIALDNDAIHCSDNKYNYVAIKYILDHLDDNFCTDSIDDNYYTVKNSETEKNILNEIQKKGSVDLDSVDLILHSKKTFIDLNIYKPYFTNLYGDRINIDSMFSDYVIFFEFVLSGKSKVTALKIRRIIKDVSKLKKEYGSRIELILINGDQFES